MYRIGKQLPSELKETALGGLAATPTAKKLEYEIKCALIQSILIK